MFAYRAGSQSACLWSVGCRRKWPPETRKSQEQVQIVRRRKIPNGSVCFPCSQMHSGCGKTPKCFLCTLRTIFLHDYHCISVHLVGAWNLARQYLICNCNPNRTVGSSKILIANPFASTVANLVSSPISLHQIGSKRCDIAPLDAQVRRFGVSWADACFFVVHISWGALLQRDIESETCSSQLSDYWYPQAAFTSRQSLQFDFVVSYYGVARTNRYAVVRRNDCNSVYRPFNGIVCFIHQAYLDGGFFTRYY